MGLTKDKLEKQVLERNLHPNERKEQLQAITENIPGVVFQFYAKKTGETGVHYTSPKLYEMFGLEFIDDPPIFLQTFVQNIHGEDRQSWIDSVHEVVEKQIPWKWTGRYVKPFGEIIWFTGSSVPTVRKDEIVFDGIFIDITEQKQAEDVLRKEHNELEQRVVEHTEELKRSQKQLQHVEKLSAGGKLSASTAHEFNYLLDEDNQGFRKEEILASFTVMNEADELKQVIVCQDIVTHYSKDENYPKRFRLESLFGVAVYQTEDLYMFKLADGTILKRIKR